MKSKIATYVKSIDQSCQLIQY